MPASSDKALPVASVKLLFALGIKSDPVIAPEAFLEILNQNAAPLSADVEKAPCFQVDL